MNENKKLLEKSKHFLSDGEYNRWLKTLDESKHLDHKETWLTLVSMYTMFGSGKISKNNIEAFNQLLNNAGFDDNFSIKNIKNVKLEEILPEVKSYREYVYNKLEKGLFHMYPDRTEKLNQKNINKKASIEGSTNLDLKIEFQENDVVKTIFIEAKYLSDISIYTTYNLVRNQIIRNIDSLIDYKEQTNLEFKDVYFALLTPKIFRTNKYGGNKSSNLDDFNPQYSRLYCYVMDRYKDYKEIKKDLPHRKFSDKDWKLISNNLGWITFDDIYNVSKTNNTYSNKTINIDDFYSIRNLT